jgi:hypothetical protein
VGSVALLVRALLLWGPPNGEAAEGPAPEQVDPARDEAAQDEAAPDETEATASSRDVDVIVEAAAQAAKDRAWLERNNQDIEEYVKHLDALADVGAELDACDGAIRAELRMALALAYLKTVGDCAEDGDAVDTPTATVEPGKLPMPVLECFESAGPRECSDRLLEHVAEFAAQGPGGTDAPFSQAFGCPHAVAEMSVEQMFGTCMVGEYEQAVARFEEQAGTESDDREVEVWPVPRWASIAGISGGAAMVIAGGVLLGIDGKCPGGHDPVTEVEQCPSVYNTNVSGGVLVGVGAVVMLGMGTVLTITEIQRSKQGKQRPTALRRRIDRAEALTGLRLSLPRPRLAHHR